MVKQQRKECLASGGAIFLCNNQTRKECFEKRIFGLSSSYAEFVEQVKAGTILFLFDTVQRQLHGVFEATSDGALDIIPDAFSAGQRFPYQIRFKRIWFCKPLTEREFQHAMQNSFVIKKASTFRLSHQQFTKLLHLFSSRKRLWPPQNPRSQDDISWEFETSSLKETDMRSSPNSNSCGSFTSYFSTLGEDATTSQSCRLIDPVSLAHRELQSGVSFISMFNSTISSLHSGADTAIVTTPSNQGAICDQATDDYIPLLQEEDIFEGVDDLFGFLHSAESENSSDSEDCNSFRQACVRKEDECYPIMVNSTLRSDMEKRKSVFSRIGRRKRSKSEAFPQMSYEGTLMLPQDEHYYRCCGDTSSVLEYTTMATWTGDGIENKNYSDHVSIANTFSFDGSQSCAHADDQECHKVVAR